MNSITDNCSLISEDDLKYKAIFQSNMDAVIFMDAEGKIFSWNPQSEKLFGWTTLEIIGKTVAETIIPPEYRDRHIKGVQRYLETNEGVFINKIAEISAIDRAGRQFPVELTIIPLSENSRHFFCAFIRDISERKSVEKKIIESEEKYRAFFEHSLDGILISSTDGKIFAANPAACEIFRMSEEEICAAGREGIVDLSDERFAKFLEMRRLTGKTKGEFRFIRKGGETFSGEVSSAVFKDISGEEKTCVILRDITERKLSDLKEKKAMALQSRLVSLNRSISFVKHPEEVYELALDTLMESIGCHKASILLFDKDNIMRFVACRNLSEKYRIATEGHSPWKPDEKNAEPVFITDASNELSLKHLLPAIKEEGISAFGFIPLIHQQQLLGKFMLYFKTPHSFTEEEIQFAQNIAGNVAFAIWEKKTAIALERSYSVLEATLESTADGILVVDSMGKIIRYNKKFTELWNIPEDIIASKDDSGSLQFVLNQLQDPVAFLEKVQELYKSDKSSFDTLYFKDHRVFVRYSTPLILGGINTGRVWSFRDVTEQRKAESTLKESEERYRTLVENAPEALVVMDMNTRKFVSVSQSAESLFKMTKEELLKVGPVELSPLIQPNGRPSSELAYEKIHEAIKGGTPSFEWTHCDKYGKEIPCEIWLVRLPSETQTLIRGSIVDISERKKAELAIKASEEKYRTLVEQASDPILIYSLDGTMIDYNNAFITVTGYQRQKIKKMKLVDLFFPEDLVKRPLHFGLIKKGLAVHDERRIRKNDGSEMIVELNSKMMPDGNIMVIGRDITERKKAELKLQESFKAIRTLTEHLQNIREEERAHIAREIHDELGQQLTVLKMDLSWINKKVGTKDEPVKARIKDLLTMIDETVKSVRRISSELRPSLLDDLGLVAAIEWQLKEFEKRFEIKTSFSHTDSEIQLRETIKTGVFRIFQESLTNVARHSRAKKVAVSLTVQNNSLILSINDNGAGFEKKILGNKKTLGILGMRERTSMMGGTYEIISKPGEGTSVVVKIPLGQH
ncbi:MAG: PAS domain S-box protein [Sphingobacteriales bacterium]|nr:PAS domain S-box protein [Sphingobacteriales bacterium]